LLLSLLSSGKTVASTQAGWKMAENAHTCFVC